MNENELRNEIVKWGGSLFERGLTAGSSGNISVRLDDGYLTTPTNSCLSDVDPLDAIPPITPYVVMRVGRVPVVAYTRPGSADIKPLIEKIAGSHAAALLRNHGPIVAGNSLDAAVFAIEELEEAAKLVILTRGMAVRMLNRNAIADLDQHFKLK